MNNTALNSTSLKAPSFASNGVLRDLIAALPIVIFSKAVRAALQQR